MIVLAYIRHDIKPTVQWCTEVRKLPHGTFYKIPMGKRVNAATSEHCWYHSRYIRRFATLTAPIYSYLPYKPLKTRKPGRRIFFRKCPVRVRMVGQVGRMEKIA
jgi:hypothetical protein